MPLAQRPGECAEVFERRDLLLIDAMPLAQRPGECAEVFERRDLLLIETCEDGMPVDEIRTFA